MKLCTLVIPHVPAYFPATHPIHPAPATHPVHPAQPHIPFIQPSPSHSSHSSSPATHLVHPAQPQPLTLFIQPSHSLPVQITQFSLTLVATQPSLTPPSPLIPSITISYLLSSSFFFFISLHTAYSITTLYYLDTPPINNMDSVPLIT